MKKRNRIKQLQTFFLIYGISILSFMLLLFVLLQIETKDALNLFIEAITTTFTFPIFWLLNLIPYLVYLLIKHLIKDYQNSSSAQFFKKLLLKIGLPSLSIYLLLLVLQSHRTSEIFNYDWDYSMERDSGNVEDFYALDQKQRGIHIFGWREGLEDIAFLQKNNFEWITITPFIGQKYHDQPEMRIISAEDSIYRRQQYLKVRKMTDSLGMRVMMKPHIWLYKLRDGKWRSDIEMQNEADWRKWFDAYKKTMLTYARIAEDLEFEQFCVGTELEKTVELKAGEWLQFIEEVKTVFSGKLTYAANWHEGYEYFPHWEKLDYIGIQAYFPLHDGSSPVKLSTLEKAWKNHARQLENFSKQHNRPILFTEIGYRSVKGTATRPWEWNEAGNILSKMSQEEQYLCYQAFFNVMWKKKWFHGIHIWEWQTRANSDGKDTNFHIENKPAFNLIMQRFKGK
ncbi:MAG: hypothetical protein AAF806_09095 [Bacteroidota bacterium]